jgi:hypothetical protein
VEVALFILCFTITSVQVEVALFNLCFTITSVEVEVALPYKQLNTRGISCYYWCKIALKFKENASIYDNKYMYITGQM